MKLLNSSLLLAGTTLIMTGAGAEARHGYGRGTLSAPSRYDYHRRHRPRNAIDLMTDMFSIPFYATNTLYRQQQDQLARMEQNIAPRYSISQSEDGKTVELAMELPGVPAKDLSVEVVDGNVLRIQGSRTIRESGSLTKSEFEQSFQLDGDMDVDNMSVSLSSGILSITISRKERVIKRIPLKIVERETLEDNLVKASTDGEGVQESSQETHADNDRVDEDFVITEDEES